jgi:membrane-associated phospholipid phosphatase
VQRLRFPCWIASLFTALSAGVAGAQVDSAPPPAFSRVEAARFGVVLGLSGLAYLGDEAARRTVRSEATQGSGLLRGATDFGNAFGQPGVLGLGALMWGGGLLGHRPTIAASGLRALEAIVVSGVVTQAIKEVAGRARPEVAPDARDDWQLLRGAREEGGDYESFASGHATAAFAFAAAVTDEVARR